MTSIATLGIHIDATQAVEATSALNDLTDAANRAADALARLKNVDKTQIVAVVRDAQNRRML